MCLLSVRLIRSPRHAMAFFPIDGARERASCRREQHVLYWGEGDLYGDKRLHGHFTVNV